MEPLIEKAVIVQVDFLNQRERFSPIKALTEFKDLVISSGAKISYEDLSSQSKPSSGLFIGKGKAERIKHIVRESHSDLEIFNHAFSRKKFRESVRSESTG